MGLRMELQQWMLHSLPSVLELAALAFVARVQYGGAVKKVKDFFDPKMGVSVNSDS